MHTSSSAESSTFFFFAVFFVAVAVVDFVWRVELRVERVGVVTGSVSPSSARFLLDNTQHGGNETVRIYLRDHA